LKNRIEGPICPQCEEDITSLIWHTYISPENDRIYHLFQCPHCKKELGVAIMQWDPPGIVTPVPEVLTCAECSEKFESPPSESFREGEFANYVLVRCPNCGAIYGAANLDWGASDKGKSKKTQISWKCAKCGEHYRRLCERLFRHWKIALSCPRCDWTYGIINAKIHLNISEGREKCRYCSRNLFNSIDQKIDPESRKVILYCHWCGKVTGVTNRNY